MTSSAEAITCKDHAVQRGEIFFDLNILHDLKKIMTSELEASGPKRYFFAFSTLLDGLAPILTVYVYSF
jgi:hypothetical protein